MANIKTGKHAEFASNPVKATASLMLQPGQPQQLIAKVLNTSQSVVSKAKTQAIRLSLMDDKRVPTSAGLEYLEWVKTQIDIFSYVKKVNQFCSTDTK